MFSRISFHIIDQLLVFFVNQVLVEEHIYFPALPYISKVWEHRLDLASTFGEHVISLDRQDIYNVETTREAVES